MRSTGYHGGSAMRKSLRIFAVASAISIISTMTSFANWEQAGTQWKYQNADGSYIMNQWVWLDGDNNGVAECYYLDANGVMAVNTVVDSYTVNESGAWVVNGVVQTKVASGSGGQSNSSQPTTNRHPDGLPIATIDSGTWEAECGDSTGLPPMH